jgi:hypothetical protein
MPSEVGAEIETNGSSAMARVAKSETVPNFRKRTKDETNGSTADPKERLTASV